MLIDIPKRKIVVWNNPGFSTLKARIVCLGKGVLGIIYHRTSRDQSQTRK